MKDADFLLLVNELNLAEEPIVDPKTAEKLLTTRFNAPDMSEWAYAQPREIGRRFVGATQQDSRTRWPGHPWHSTFGSSHSFRTGVGASVRGQTGEKATGAKAGRRVRRRSDRRATNRTGTRRGPGPACTSRTAVVK